MHALSRVARESAGRLAALGAATGATTAASRPAHAQRLQRQDVAARPQHGLACQDDWLITQVDAGEVLFHPEDIDAAAHEVLQLVPRLRHEHNSESSDGQAATDVIEASDISHTPAGGVGQYAVLMRVASELMKRPGVQQEVVSVILQDPELLNILGEQHNMDSYLKQWGISSSGLLPPATITEEGEQQDGPGEERSPLDKLLEPLLSALDHLGGAMHRVGDWLKAAFHGPSAGEEGQSAGGASGGDAQGQGAKGHFFGAFAGSPVVLAAVTLGVALVCVVLLRRPALVAALLRRRAVATAAAAAATAAAKMAAS